MNIFASSLGGSSLTKATSPFSEFPKVGAIHTGDANRFFNLTGEANPNQQMFDPPNQHAYESLADYAASTGLKYLWIEAEGGVQGSMRWAGDLWTAPSQAWAQPTINDTTTLLGAPITRTGKLEAQARMGRAKTALQFIKNRQPKLKVGLEHACPAPSAGIVSDLSDLWEYEVTLFKEIIDFGVQILYVDAPLTYWNRNANTIAERVKRYWPHLPQHLLFTHQDYYTNQVVTDRFLASVFRKAKKFGWDLEFWSVVDPATVDVPIYGRNETHIWRLIKNLKLQYDD